MKNDTALIIGNGPSVDKLDPALFDHFTTYGCNHIYKKFPAWGRPTDNVVITDSNRINEIGEAYKDYQGGLYIGDDRYAYPPVKAIRKTIGRDFVPIRQLKKETLDRFSFLDSIRWHPLAYTLIFHRGRLTFDMEKGLNFGYSVVTSAVQLATIHGFKTILLTGVDTSYSTPKDYFAGAANDIAYVNKQFTSNPRAFMEPILVLLQVYLEQLGVRLIDCTPGGRLRFIDKGEFVENGPFYALTRAI